jgi:hypothetical protein
MALALSAGSIWPSAKTAASVRSCTPCPMARRSAMEGPKKTAWRRRRCSAVAADSARKAATVGRDG